MRPAHLAQVLEEEFLSAAGGDHTPVMIWGPPGVGKSQIVAQIAERHGAAMTDIRLSQMEPSDLRGIPFRSGDTVDWAPPAMLPDAARHGARGVLFLDELTAAAPTVSAAAYQLILDRRLGGYRVPDGWAIFAAGNRQGDRGVSYVMPAPLANRFSHFEIEAHLDDWARWAYARGIDARVIGFLRLRPELLFEFDAERNPAAFPSPRSWEFASRALRKFGDRDAVLAAALQACVGAAAGAQLHAFVQHAAELPDLDALLADPEAAPAPASVDLQYAVAAALVGRAARAAADGGLDGVLGPALRYAARLPERELGVMLVCDLQRALGERVFQAPEFAPWAERAAELLVYD